MSAPSLLSFLGSPVAVGDPDGRAAYVNPAFERDFSVSAERITGQPLASLFEGGVREAVLQAVAEVCEKGTSARFRVRHGSIGYAGLASPIVAQDARVGCVILFSESAPDDERVHALEREGHAPVEELGRVLDELSEHAAVGSDKRVVALLEDGLKAVERLRKQSAELHQLLGGRRPARPRSDRFDPAQVAGDVAARVSEEFARCGVGLEMRIPAQLPRVAGDANGFGEALDGLLRARLVESGAGSSVTLQARTVERGDAAFVVIAVTDSHGEAGVPDSAEPEPEAVRRTVQEMGGELRTTSDPVAGRTTAIRLHASKQ
jgi:hypothetical protein